MGVSATSRATTPGRASALGRLADPMRDIARGGLAGLLSGFLVAGIGGRIVMRTAALQVPAAAGRFTDNGNRIGEITLSGTLGLVLVGGLFFGLAGATVWAVVSPWIPGGTRLRAVLAMPIAVALVGLMLVQARNPDFQVLEHNAATVGLLVFLVALAGLVISLLDSWLDRRLPVANASTGADAVYLVLTLAGGGLIFPGILGLFLSDEPPVGLALVGVGLATLTWWSLRFRGRREPPPWLMVAARGSLALSVLLGVLALAPDVSAVLGFA